MSQLETRQMQTPSSLHSLAVSTTKLDMFTEYEERMSPISTKTSYCGFLASTGRGLLGPEAMRSTEELGPISLPPPPRRTPRRKRVPSYAAEETRLSIPETRGGVMPLDESVDEHSPTMAWLQREGYSRGSISGPRAVSMAVVEEEKSTTESNVVAAAVSAARAALEEAVAAATDPSGASKAKGDSVSSFEDVRVAEKQLLRTSKPRIIVPTTEPGSPTRLSVDDNALPPTPHGDGPCNSGTGSTLPMADCPCKPVAVRTFMTERGIVADRPWRRSHAKCASRSSVDSSTTYNPPSTIDPRDHPRISISSTIYPTDTTALSPPNATLGLTHDSDEDDNDDYQHEPYPRNDILDEILAEQIIDSDNYQLMSILSGTNILHSRSRYKPPIPRTPKPIFTRKPLSGRSSPSQSPLSTSLIFEGYQSSDCEPPPTTNWRGQEERADLVRKSRKLARVFGRTPGPDVMAYQDGSRSISQAITPKHRHQRTPFSFSNDIDNTGGARKRRTHFSSSSESRLCSLPLSRDDISFLNTSSPLYDASLSQVALQVRCESSATGTTGLSFNGDDSSTDLLHHEGDPNNTTQNGASSPSHTSFIDWSEEEGPNDGLSIISQDPPVKTVGSRRPPSPTQSFFENMTPEEQAEEDKRRKRDKLAKLHRFLGSTVPVGLVVGSELDHRMTSRPTTATSTPSGSDLDEASRKAWLRRRRSSSAAAAPASWSDDVDRMKEELNTQEKLINVRRAQKMEKVFGVAPPQTLYRTRGHTPSPSLPSLAPVAPKTLGNPSAFIPSSDNIYITKNPNRSAYEKPSGKFSHHRKNGRPTTADSTKQLIPKGHRASFTTSFSSPPAPSYGHADGNEIFKRSSQNRSSTQPSIRSPTSGMSSNQEQVLASNPIYNHYQHSLNSLNDIIDRDDRESLVELHQYLNNDVYRPETRDALSTKQDDLLASSGTFERRPSDASSVATERRLSLPTRTSFASLASEHTVADNAPVTPKTELTDFQQRRRRAAKLTQFFGVQYRELINDVLDSLENGLEHEEKRGTLQADEIANLLERLRELKVKREGIST